ncbi:MAG TPA: hypothetical protein VFS36_13595 [Chitinophagaceae bacterium]|jgi:hypothetical protein|nr:hypothetical protein [Chitinophagaceae bacterium]
MAKNRQLLILFGLFSLQLCSAQQSFLFVKKRGRKVKTYFEGDRLKIQSRTNDLLDGTITLLRNDSVYINSIGFSSAAIQKIFLKRKTRKPFPIDGRQALYITGAVALSTFGMTAAGWEPAGRSLLYSSTIGFGPILLTAAARKINLKRKYYRIGKKYRLQVLDFYLPDKNLPPGLPAGKRF